MRRWGLDYDNGVEDNMVSVPDVAGGISQRITMSRRPKDQKPTFCVSLYYWPLSKIAKAPQTKEPK